MNRYLRLAAAVLAGFLVLTLYPFLLPEQVASAVWAVHLFGGGAAFLACIPLSILYVSYYVGSQRPGAVEVDSPRIHDVLPVLLGSWYFVGIMFATAVIHAGLQSR